MLTRSSQRISIQKKAAFHWEMVKSSMSFALWKQRSVENLKRDSVLSIFIFQIKIVLLCSATIRIKMQFYCIHYGLKGKHRSYLDRGSKPPCAILSQSQTLKAKVLRTNSPRGSEPSLPPTPCLTGSAFSLPPSCPLLTLISFSLSPFPLSFPSPLTFLLYKLGCLAWRTVWARFQTHG